jgi:hypothetical protein
LQNRRALADLRPERVEQVLQASLEARRALTAELADLAPGQFSAQSTRVVLAQVEDVIEQIGEQYGDSVGGIVEELGIQAAPIARTDLEAQLAAWAAEHPGAARARARVPEAGAALDSGLLEYYASSRQRYGDQQIAQMRASLATGLLRGDTLVQTADRLAADLDLKPYQAERIVRTEQSLAFHRTWQVDAEQALAGEVDEWRKELVATFDSRTGQDSKFVDGQQRKLDEDFEDNEGRVYPYPPNRPNDRETVILVLA